jgi:sortase A
VLGIVGRTLVTVGVLMFAFVAYQLWGTGIQTAREQSRLRREFAEMLETTVPLTSLAPVTTIEPPTTDTAAPDTTTTETTTPIEELPPPVVTAPSAGGALAQLDIPRMGLERKVVVEGVSPSNLQDGPGHFPETPLPGQLGNSAIAGHRTSHGQPFHRIDQLEVGDEITVTTLAGTYIYVVTGQTIVSPNDYAKVIPTLDPTKATLTLTSCHPAHSTKQRIAVFAELDIGRSSPMTLPATAIGDEPGSDLPGEELPDQTSATTDPPPTSAATATTDPAVTEPPSTEATGPSSTEPVATSSVDDEVDPPADSIEVFGNEWFSDPDAIPHVVLWGLACTAVAVGAYLVARRARRYWVGALVGFLPFVVVLYFFFENVNRLLPPNL